MTSNPLLSEFPSVLQRRITKGKVFVGFFSLGMACCILSKFAHAQAFEAQVTYSSKHPISSLYFGYLAELNHGPFYLLIVPFLVLLVCGWLESFKSALLELWHSQLFCVNSAGNALPKETFATFIAKKNRTVFRWIILPFVSIFGVVIIWAPEIAEHRTEKQVAFGWVQAPYLHLRNHRTLSDLKKSYVLGTLERVPETCSDLPRDPLTPQCNPPCTATVALAGSLATEVTACYWIFFSLSLALATAFIALSLWFAAKIAFVLLLLLDGFKNLRTEVRLAGPTDRNQEPRQLRVKLQYIDEKGKRFGLRALDQIYTGGMLLVLIGAVAFVASTSNNVAKGSSFMTTPTTWGLVGQAVIPLVVVGTGILLVVLPACVFNALTKRAKDAELDKRGAEIDAFEHRPPRTHEEKEELQELINAKEIVRDQSAFPKGDGVWWSFTVLSILFMLSGFGVAEAMKSRTGIVIEIIQGLPKILFRLFG